jgi:hypothetical protein
MRWRWKGKLYEGTLFRAVPRDRLNVEKLINEARKRGLVLKKARREQNRALTVELSPRDYGRFQSLPGKWAMKSARRNRWDRSG